MAASYCRLVLPTLKIVKQACRIVESGRGRRESRAESEKLGAQVDQQVG